MTSQIRGIHPLQHLGANVVDDEETRGTSRICFLGYIIKSGQVRADPEKSRAVAEWPRPTMRKRLQRFLGFAHFYLHFIK